VHDAAVFARVDRVLFESERAADPLDRGGRISLAQARDDIRFGLLGELRHEIAPSLFERLSRLHARPLYAKREPVDTIRLT
jgi:hypothetical protein